MYRPKIKRQIDPIIKTISPDKQEERAVGITPGLNEQIKFYHSVIL